MSKVVVITGAAKGIGAATAVAFSKAGYDVVVNYLNDTQAANKVAASIVANGQRAVLAQADIFTEDGIRSLFTTVLANFPKIDVLVNNAADPSESGFGTYTYDEISKNLGVNFGSSVLCSQEAVKIMDQGSILFTSSIYGLNFGGNPGLMLYSASKAAMINFAQTMAEKLAPKISCNVVAPGSTLTPHWKDPNGDYAKTSLSMTLQNDWVQSEEIANAFVFLAETPHITAQTIVIDGGWQKKIRPQPAN